MKWIRAAARPLIFCALVLAAAASISRSQTTVHSSPASSLRTPDLSPVSRAQQAKALAKLGVDQWHSAGFVGRGVKIAVLDSGFHDYRSFLGSVLPANVTVKSFRADGNLEARDSQHGILCGEVIHTVAPEAELLFVNWEPDRPWTFGQAVLWAKEQGASILSCSLIMPCWSDGEGGGNIHESLAKIIGDGEAAGDMLFFASAGNLAQRHWSGPVVPDKSGYHQWTPAHRNNVLTAWGEERVSVEMYGPACDGLELLVLDTGSGKEIGRCKATSANGPCGTPCAVVRFEPKGAGKFHVRVKGKPTANDNNQAFHLVALGGNLQYTTASGSIPFPGDGSAMNAVGAVDSDGRRLNYSSCGPNSPLPKPDFVAQVPFPSMWRDRPFAGTSAAAPQASALAALLWARYPTWTANQVSQKLRESSRDLGPVGHDWETGHGLLRMPGVD